jgi:uncharacterized membrane protein
MLIEGWNINTQVYCNLVPLWLILMLMMLMLLLILILILLVIFYHARQRKDMSAGFSVFILLIPQGLAYALLAGD